MRLELEILHIHDVQFSDHTAVQEGVLFINRRELQDVLEQDQRLKQVEIALAHPGESCRILQVADVIEPRAKIEKGTVNFPGALGKVETVGNGRTRVLQGAAVVLNDQSSTEDIAEADNDIGIVIDMSGPGAEVTPYSATHNIVILPYPTDGLSHDGYKVALKMAGLKTATYLARASKGVEPDEREVYSLPPLTEVARGNEDLPKVAYNFQVYCTSYPAVPGEPILYGDNIRHLLPTLIHPNEVLDGALINPYHGIGTETYILQNHPVIKELYRRHGRDVCFVGVILTVSRYTEPDRERVVAMVSNLAKSVLGADGIIITKSSSGAPDVDVAQTAHACEQRGIQAVLIMFDRSDGAEVGAVFNLPGARSIVSTANQYQELRLPSVERAIGRSVVLPSGIRSDGEFSKAIRWIRGALDQEGHSQIRPIRY